MSGVEKGEVAMIDRVPMIVVVHESPRILTAIESLFVPREYQVTTFTHRARSLDYIRRSKADLILAQEAPTKPEGLEYLESLKAASPSSEGFFLPSPLELESDGRSLRRAQADGILRIVDRLLFSLVIPETRRYTVATRPVVGA